MSDRKQKKETSKAGGKREVEAREEELETSEKKKKGRVSKIVQEVVGQGDEYDKDLDDGNQDDLDENGGEMEMSEGHGSEAGNEEEEDEPSAHFSDCDDDDKESNSDYKKLYLNLKEYIRQLEANCGVTQSRWKTWKIVSS